MPDAVASAVRKIRMTEYRIREWVEQDVLEYIHCYHLPIASVYGEVRVDYGEHGKSQVKADSMDMRIFDLGKPIYTTTGNRTGCVYCGFRSHREKSPNRWEIAEKFSKPEIIDYVMRGGSFDNMGIWKPDDGGLGFWFVIKWINLHGGLHISYSPEFSDNPQVQAAIKEIIERFPDKEVIDY